MVSPGTSLRLQGFLSRFTSFIEISTHQYKSSTARPLDLASHSKENSVFKERERERT